MARTRDDQAFAAKRREILDAAEALFVENGFHQTGMAAICEAAGMSPGGLYRYFASKTDIIRAIVETERESVLEMVEAIERAPDFRSGLVAALDEAITAVSDPDYASLALEIAAEGARNEDVGATVRETGQEAHEQLAGAIARARTRGEVAGAVNPDAAAAMILMLIDGAMSDMGKTFAAQKSRTRKAALARFVDAALGPPTT